TIDAPRHALPPFAKATKGRSRAYDPGRPRRSVCGRVAQTPDGRMLTVLRPRDSPNCTFPSTSAKSVSSPPRPTFAPGWNLVPRCRTRISPAWTDWPPKRLTPSRCAFESRPLRELDAPFLCAIYRSLLLAGRRLGRAYPGHHQLGQPLTVTHALVVPGLVLELVDADLRPLGLCEYLGCHRNRRELVGVMCDLLAIDEKHGGQ